MDYLRGGLWKYKCWEELRTRATEQIIEAINRKLYGQFKCEKFNMETKGFVFWGGGEGNPTLFPAPLSTFNPSTLIHIHYVFTSSPPSKESSVVPCLVLLTWTMVPLLLSCEKEHPDNSHWLFSNCPTGRITSSVWCFKVPLIPLEQASLTLADFSFLNPLSTLSHFWFLGLESIVWC